MPLHLLDNLANLTDPASSRNALALGTGDSPQFASITTSGATISGSLNVTDSVDFNGGVTFQTSFSGFIDLNAPTITSTATIINLNAADIALNATNAITVGAPINSSITLNGSLTASGIVTSPQYAVTNTNGNISTTKSVTTWEFGTKTFSVNTQATTPRGIDFNNTGTRVFVLNSTAGAIGVYQYDLSPSSPWDITTAVYSSVSKSLTGVPVGIKFSTDGLYMFISNDTGDTVVRYTLVNPWDLNTVSVNPDQTYTLTNVTNGVTTLTVPRGIDFSSDGTRMYVTDDNQNSVYQFNLVTPWSVNTAVYSGNSINVNSGVGESLPQHAVISDDGARLIIIGQTTDRIWEYTLPTPYSLSGAVVHGWMRVLLTSTTNINTPVLVFIEGASTGLYYNSIENKCFFIGTGSLRIQEVDVTPQILITGKRPVILGNDTGTGSRMVRMNSLYITDSTNLNSQATGALIVNGGIACNSNIAVAGGCAAGSFQAGNPGGVFWSSSSKINAPSNGVITISNNNTTDFFRLQFGGITASFPAIKRNGTGLDIVNAADTVGGFTDLRAANITATSGLIAGGNALSTSGSFSLALSHLGRVIRYNDAPAIIVTVPDQSTVAWPDGSAIYLRRNAGAGAITIQGSGAAIINDNASASVLGGNMMAIRRVTTDQWDFI